MQAPGPSPLPTASNSFQNASAPPYQNDPPPSYADYPPNPTDKGIPTVYPSMMPPMPNQVPPNYPAMMSGQTWPMPPGPPRSNQPIIIGSIAFANRPQEMACPYCNQQIVTSIKPKAGLLTYLLCGGLAFFGCWVCCCIPFCVESAQDIDHTCPRCNRFLGTHKRI